MAGKKRGRPRKNTGTIRSVEGEATIDFPIVPVVDESLEQPSPYQAAPMVSSDSTGEPGIEFVGGPESCVEVRECGVCVDYEGQDYFCKVHEAKVECPECHCIDVERETRVHAPSIKNYRCTICGIFYMRREETGEYIHG